MYNSQAHIYMYRETAYSIICTHVQRIFWYFLMLRYLKSLKIISSNCVIGGGPTIVVDALITGIKKNCSFGIYALNKLNRETGFNN